MMASALLLNNTFQTHNLEVREDSNLCHEFIFGNINDKCVEEIAAIVSITNNLFYYGRRTYYEFREECNLALRKYMFKNYTNPDFTWMNATEVVLQSYSDRFEKFAYRRHYWY